MKQTAILLFVISAAAVAGCETASTVTSSPNPVKCQVSLASMPMVDAGGGTATLGISTQPECAWDVSSTVAWISGLAPTTGQGNGNVQFRVAPNDGNGPREGALVVNGDQAHVTQRAPCRYDLAPASLSVDAGGGASTLTVVTLSDCAWTATTDVNWIALSSSPTGNGNGTVGITVAANSGDRRVGGVIVGGQRSTVTQASGIVTPPPTPCTYAIAAVSFSAGATGGPGTVAVSAGSGCAWTAVSSASWITITSGAAGTANGSVGFSVAANTGASRTGTLTIAGRAFTVTQAAAGGAPPPPPPPASCTYSISPSSKNVGALGGVDGVQVSTASGCAWTASGGSGWILITSGASGTGNGTVNYSVVANLGAARTGTLAIAGQTFTVTQAAVAPCSYSISPGTQKVEAPATTGSVSVTTASHCTWTGVSNVSWITVTSGATGTGNGTVTFNIAANPGKDRKGTLTVAGKTATVEQKEQ